MGLVAGDQTTISANLCSPRLPDMGIDILSEYAYSQAGFSPENCLVC